MKIYWQVRNLQRQVRTNKVRHSQRLLSLGRKSSQITGEFIRFLSAENVKFSHAGRLIQTLYEVCTRVGRKFQSERRGFLEADHSHVYLWLNA
jgi:hypothetical protein